MSPVPFLILAAVLTALDAIFRRGTTPALNISCCIFIAAVLTSTLMSIAFLDNALFLALLPGLHLFSCYFCLRLAMAPAGHTQQLAQYLHTGILYNAAVGGVLLAIHLFLGAAGAGVYFLLVAVGFTLSSLYLPAVTIFFIFLLLVIASSLVYALRALFCLHRLRPFAPALFLPALALSLVPFVNSIALLLFYRQLDSVPAD